jgi:hypothetical protein
MKPASFEAGFLYTWEKRDAYAPESQYNVPVSELWEEVDRRS